MRDDTLAQAAVALLGDAAKPFFATAGVLLGGKPDPGRQVAPGLKGVRISDAGDKSGEQRPDARDFDQPPPDIGRPRAAADPAVGFQDLSVDQL